MITVVGEALVDLVSSDGRHYRAHPGGSPTNVAIGLSRLDIEVSLLARIGTDPFGRMLSAHLADNGVSDRDLVTADESTTLAVAALDSSGGASYDFYVQGTTNWQWTEDELPHELPSDVTALHAGSLALALPPGDEHVEALLAREHTRGAVTISLDPNVRPALFGEHDAAVRRAERQVGLSDVVKVSAEDLDWLYPGSEPLDVAADWLGRGPALVVVTLGGKGAAAVGASAGTVTVPAASESARGLPAVVDTVGAGDAFSAGLLAALHDERLLGGAARGRLAAVDDHWVRSLLERAGLVAALTCGRAGADPPTRAEVAAIEASLLRQGD